MTSRQPAHDLLLDAAANDSATTWFVPGGTASLVEDLGHDHPDALVQWQPVDVREAGGEVTAEGRLAVQEPGTVGDLVERVVMTSPPDRDLARRWLLAARERLVSGGQLYLAGANAEGIRSVIADAGRVFGPPIREGFGQKQRLAVFAAGEDREVPPWASAPGVAPGTWDSFTVTLAGQAVELVTQAGVFPGAKVDLGTRLLLEAMPELEGASVLDVGCGAGVIGIAAALAGAGRVEMLDANLLAVQAARENGRRLALSEVSVVAGDVFPEESDVRYDLIVSNPPFHRGKEIDYTVADRLIAEASRHLAPGGSLLVVANAFLAYGKRMAGVFGTVETVSANRQFHVIRASDPRRAAS